MSETLSHDEWKALYAAAMLETDSTQMRHRIELADSAMRARLRHLPDVTLSPRSEQEELHSALIYLRCLRKTLEGDVQ
jgi:hypothetical protein